MVWDWPPDYVADDDLKKRVAREKKRRRLHGQN